MTIDYSSIYRLSQIWPVVSQKFPDSVALHSPHSQPEVKLTYSQLWDNIRYFAAGLQVLGLEKEDKISIFADNSPRWLIVDQGSMAAGGVNVVRSAIADVQELLYILKDSDSVALIVEDLKTLNRLQLQDVSLRFIILLSDETAPLETNYKLLNYQQVLELGSTSTLIDYQGTSESLATLIYTSGTTGQPKGVMLSHKNLLHQVVNFKVILKPKPGDCLLSILPSWHSYERSCEYYFLSQGCSQVYTNIRYFKNDLNLYQPQIMVGVPRIWESLYEGIEKQFQQYPANKQKLIYTLLDLSERYILNQRIFNSLSLDNLYPSLFSRLVAGVKSLFLSPFHFLGDQLIYKTIRTSLGGHLTTLVSGGGALAKHLDTFYEIIGVPILVGYGLTETSPVTNVRTFERNLRGAAGQPLPHTEVRIINPETRQTLPAGSKGIVLVRGPQVMQGYYKKPEATAKVIDAEGWFDTGDIGWVSLENDLILTGRAKDTIVLSNGENIEPDPLENACLRSPYIQQIMIVGQDQKTLGALIVPNLEALKNWASQEGLSLEFPKKESDHSVRESDLYNKKVLEKLRQEMNREIKNRPGYRSDDQIKTFELILEPFSLENGLMTQTLKIKRPVVMERYHDIIVGMFDK